MPAGALDQNAEFFAKSLVHLNDALSARDESMFDAVLAGIVTGRPTLHAGTPPDVIVDLRRVTQDLHAALERFRFDSRLVSIAEKEMPDARARLEHVLTLTDDAAHRTLDLVEQSIPAADGTARAAREQLELWRARTGEDMPELVVFLSNTVTNMEAVREKLSEVLLAQGYQDLTGQIIRGVMKLVGELEHALGDLVRLSGVSPSATPVGPVQSDARGFGPVVPGVDHGVHVDGQQDVDALLSDLGM
jgi:chemotaxis protein CheZ